MDEKLRQKYEHKLAQLKREIAIIKQKRTKKFKKNEQAMADFINGVTKHAKLDIKGQNVFVYNGDEKKGFIHILLNHYKDDDLEAKDILNIAVVLERGIRMNNVGVSNKNLSVYKNIAKQKEHILVLNQKNPAQLVVTYYRKNGTM